MKEGDYTYIWQATDWPNWRFDHASLAQSMVDVSRAQGMLIGRLADVGLALRDQASLLALTEDVIKTSEIEGEQLNVESVRSSVARRLGVDIGALAPVDRHVDGVVDMVLDATANCNAPVTRGRLLGWHAALFPSGFSSMDRINVGGGGVTMPLVRCRWSLARWVANACISKRRQPTVWSQKSTAFWIGPTAHQRSLR